MTNNPVKAVKAVTRVKLANGKLGKLAEPMVTAREFEDCDAQRDYAELMMSGCDQARRDLAEILGLDEPRWSSIILEVLHMKSQKNSDA